MQLKLATSTSICITLSTLNFWAACCCVPSWFWVFFFSLQRPWTSDHSLSMARVDPLHEAYYATGYPGLSHHHSYPIHHTFRSRPRSPVSSLGRSSPDSDDYCHQETRSKMRWILSLGLLLPALAAIIGKFCNAGVLVSSCLHVMFLFSFYFTNFYNKF